MKKFTKIAAQGDVLFRKVADIPSSATPVAADDRDELIVTHSETGHHHIMVIDRQADGPAVEMFNSADNPLLAWLKVNRPTALEHRRPHDTHEPIMFSPGIYEVRRQREHTPDGWRQVQD